jgi:hypothetical protein
MPETVRSHIHPSWFLGVVPPSAVAIVPSGALRRSPVLRCFAGIHWFSEGSQNRWLLVVWMTSVPWLVLTVRL